MNTQLPNKKQWLGDPLVLLSSPYPLTDSELWSRAEAFANKYCDEQETLGHSVITAVHPFLEGYRIIKIPLDWPEAKKYIINCLVAYYRNIGICAIR